VAPVRGSAEHREQARALGHRLPASGKAQRQEAAGVLFAAQFCTNVHYFVHLKSQSFISWENFQYFEKKNLCIHWS